MPFIKFTETARSYKSKVSLRSNGTIGLSAGAVAKFLKNGHEYATLFYDADAHIIGVKPTTKEEEGSHKINRGKTGAWIGARRFLDFMGISTKGTKKYEAAWDSNEDMIVIQI